MTINIIGNGEKEKNENMTSVNRQRENKNDEYSNLDNGLRRMKRISSPGTRIGRGMMD